VSSDNIHKLGYIILVQSQLTQKWLRPRVEIKTSIFELIILCCSQMGLKSCTV